MSETNTPLIAVDIKKKNAKNYGMHDTYVFVKFEKRKKKVNVNLTNQILYVHYISKEFVF